MGCFLLYNNKKQWYNLVQSFIYTNKGLQMAVSRAERIRTHLEKNPNVSAVALAQKLKVSPQAIYQERHNLKKAQMVLQQISTERREKATATRQENEKSLSHYILQVLELHPEGLTDQQLTVAVQKAGYKTRSTAFLTLVRQRLYQMSEVGTIVKNGTSYVHRSPLVRPTAKVVEGNPTLILLNEIAQLCQRAGGIDKVQEYLGIIRLLQTPEKS
jgi:hypothetical protein